MNAMGREFGSHWFQTIPRGAVPDVHGFDERVALDQRKGLGRIAKNRLVRPFRIRGPGLNHGERVAQAGVDE